MMAKSRIFSEPPPVQPTYQQPAQSPSSEEDDDDDIPDMNEINIRTSLSSVDPRDERIYELEDRIEELQLELDQKNLIIRQKDAVSCSTKTRWYDYVLRCMLPIKIYGFAFCFENDQIDFSKAQIFFTGINYLYLG